MKPFLYTVLIILMCSNTQISQAGQRQSVIITTQDDKQQSIDADRVRWWFTNVPEDKQFLNCDNAPCSEWILDAEIDSEINVYAVASRTKQNDALCDDLYEGKASIQPGQTEATITLAYSVTVCK